MSFTPTRLTGEARRAIIVQAGALLANNLGRIVSVTHDVVAERCEVETSISTVRRYYPTKTDLWRAISSSTDLAHDVDRTGVDDAG